jgi:hypothetical protein
MERHEILEAMTELKLYGMRASFDEIAGKGLARRDEIFPLLTSLIRAERTHRQARSINYRMSGAKFPVLKDIAKFVFADTPVDEGLDATGPVTIEVVPLLGRGACFKAPFSSSISSACRPTIRSRAAILASYSCSRSAACTSSSRAPASNLPTQIRISCREMSCRLDNPCSVSPAMNSSAT